MTAASLALFLCGVGRWWAHVVLRCIPALYDELSSTTAVQHITTVVGCQNPQRILHIR